MSCLPDASGLELAGAYRGVLGSLSKQSDLAHVVALRDDPGHLLTTRARLDTRSHVNIRGLSNCAVGAQ